MKIVINKCYGGFSLSPQAVKRMAELQGKACYFFHHDSIDEQYYPVADIEKAARQGQFWFAFSIPNPNEVLNASGRKWIEMSLDERRDRNATYAQYGLSERPENRTDPALIQVVQELGEAANGRFADLSVVEIPDGIEWEIDEYDGIETIQEAHRPWG